MALHDQQSNDHQQTDALSREDSSTTAAPSLGMTMNGSSHETPMSGSSREMTVDGEDSSTTLGMTMNGEGAATVLPSETTATVVPGESTLSTVLPSEAEPFTVIPSEAAPSTVIPSGGRQAEVEESRPAGAGNAAAAVAAVVVTFNRLEKLKTVLASLEAQTRLPDQLIIVNNASTDDTAAYLADYEHDFKLKDKVQLTIVTLPENAGGAGGFSAGMRKGYELGADFVWIFDDDGYPQPDALAKLVDGFNTAVEELGPDVPYACSMVKYIDGTISEMNNPIPTWDWGRLQAKGHDNLVMVTSCSFVSVLIPRWVMEAYGLPYKEYFIWFDDAEYTLRITKACPGVEVLDSVVLHDMGVNKGVNFSMIDEKNEWKFAYGVRNQASYRLHHEGRAKYLIFCATVIRQMRRGGVAKPLRRKMIKQMIEAIRFNPQVDFPQVAQQQ